VYILKVQHLLRYPPSTLRAPGIGDVSHEIREKKYEKEEKKAANVKKKKEERKN
jgi:hypothetical protein